MNCEDMSDDEIASRVLNCTGYRSIDCGYGYEIFLSKESRKDVGIKSSGKFKFDPCNRVSDAWPIIESIWTELSSVVRFDDGLGFGVRDVAMWSAQVKRMSCGKLRAAMIVFLMMQESK